MPPEKVRLRNGNIMEFAAGQALLPSRQVMAGRLVSDGILVTTPYDRARPNEFGIVESANDEDIAARLFVDGIRLDKFNSVIKTLPDVDPLQQNPEHRYGATPERAMADPTHE